MRGKKEQIRDVIAVERVGCDTAIWIHGNVRDGNLSTAIEEVITKVDPQFFEKIVMPWY